MLTSELSALCSVAMCDTNAFQSTRFIAARHEELEQESAHQLLRKFEYRNHYGYTKYVAIPIFGLGSEETIDLINKMLDSPRVDWSRVSRAALHAVNRRPLSLKVTSSPSL